MLGLIPGCILHKVYVDMVVVLAHGRCCHKFPGKRPISYDTEVLTLGGHLTYVTTIENIDLIPTEYL